MCASVCVCVCVAATMGECVYSQPLAVKGCFVVDVYSAHGAATAYSRITRAREGASWGKRGRPHVRSAGRERASVSERERASVCLSVRRLVRPPVGPSACLSVGHTRRMYAAAAAAGSRRGQMRGGAGNARKGTGYYGSRAFAGYLVHC